MWQFKPQKMRAGLWGRRGRNLFTTLSPLQGYEYKGGESRCKCLKPSGRTHSLTHRQLGLQYTTLKTTPWMWFPITPSTLEAEMPPLWKLLNSTRQILSFTDPNLTAHCWLCYNIRPSFYEAVGIPLESKLVNAANPKQCLWNTGKEYNPGITMQHVSGQGRCIGKIPHEKRHLCENETSLKNRPRADWLIPAGNAKWVCSKTGITPCISLKVFNENNEYCIQVMIVPRIIYHSEEFIYSHQTLLASHYIQKWEPVTAVTIAVLLAMGVTGVRDRNSVTSRTKPKGSFPLSSSGRRFDANWTIN